MLSDGNFNLYEEMKNLEMVKIVALLVSYGCCNKIP